MRSTLSSGSSLSAACSCTATPPWRSAWSRNACIAVRLETIAPSSFQARCRRQARARWQRHRQAVHRRQPLSRSRGHGARLPAARPPPGRREPRNARQRLPRAETGATAPRRRRGWSGSSGHPAFRARAQTAAAPPGASAARATRPRWFRSAFPAPRRRASPIRQGVRTRGSTFPKPPPWYRSGTEWPKACSPQAAAG